MIDKIIQGRWQDYTPSLADGSVALTVTDPPYRATPAEWDKKRPDWLPLLSELGRLGGDSGQLWIFVRAPWSVDVILAARETGWRFVQERIWRKQNAGGPSAGGLLRKIHETIYHFAKPGAPAFNLREIREPKKTKGNKSVKRRGSAETTFMGVEGSAYVDDGFRLPQTVQDARNVHRSAEATGHPTQKPLAVIEPLIRYSSQPGDLVLDPYAGSGTTAVAAASLDRRFVAVELTERWANVARRRVCD